MLANMSANPTCASRLGTKLEIHIRRLSTISVAAKPRTAIVINIFVSVGMFVRNSVISSLRCSRPVREEEHRNCEQVPTRPRKGGRCDLRADEGGPHAASKK